MTSIAKFYWVIWCITIKRLVPHFAERAGLPFKMKYLTLAFLIIFLCARAIARVTLTRAYFNFSLNYNSFILTAVLAELLGGCHSGYFICHNGYLCHIDYSYLLGQGRFVGEMFVSFGIKSMNETGCSAVVLKVSWYAPENHVLGYALTALPIY